MSYELPGLDGMALVFGTQARPYQSQTAWPRYVPLCTTTVVIAVNRNGNSIGAIGGWRTLLQSEATVLIPQNATEGGRLAAIAPARGVGAVEGDHAPAIRSLRTSNHRAVSTIPLTRPNHWPELLKCGWTNRRLSFLKSPDYRFR